MKYERIKFLVIALRDSIEIYAWAPKPYHKFMAFKSFSELQHKPLLVDLTVEEGTRLKVLYGSANGFHAVDLDSAQVYDIYTPKHAQGAIVPHTIVTLPNSNGMQLLLCYDNEGVYVNTYGKVSKNIVLQVIQLLTLYIVGFYVLYNFEARMERVNFGLFQLNSDFTRPNLTL